MTLCEWARGSFVQTLQCTATHTGDICVSHCEHFLKGKTLQHTAIHCNTLQHTATHYDTLLFVANCLCVCASVCVYAWEEECVFVFLCVCLFVRV